MQFRIVVPSPVYNKSSSNIAVPLLLLLLLLLYCCYSCTGQEPACKRKKRGERDDDGLVVCPLLARNLSAPLKQTQPPVKKQTSTIPVLKESILR